MADLLEGLMESNLARVVNERGPRRRRAAIAETYAPQVRWTGDNYGPTP